MNKFCLYIIASFLVIGCSGNKSAKKKPKPKEPLAIFIERAYDQKESDFKALLRNDTLNSVFTLDQERRYYDYVLENFNHCLISRDTDEVNYRIFYTIKAYRSELTLGDYTEITINTWDAPGRDIISAGLGPIETQIAGSFLDDMGDWVTGEWKPNYEETKNEFGRTVKKETQSLKLYVDGHFIELSGGLRFSIDDCSNAEKILAKDENGYVYRFDVDDTDHSNIYILNDDNILKICNLFETKESLLLSFVDRQNERLGSIHITNHEAGHIVGAIRKHIKEEKLY